MPTKWIAFSVNLLVALLFLREELAKRDIPWGALFFGLLVVYTITRGLWPWWADLALKGLALVVAVAPLVPGVLYANHTLLLVGWTLSLPGILTLLAALERKQAVAKKPGGPVRVVKEVGGKKPPDFPTLEKRLKGRVLGQDHAVEAVVRGLKRKAAGLSRREKPFSAMLAGPTGTGKTELAKALADALGRPFVRYDMNQYGQDHTVAALVGSPPGYVGSDRPGRLYEDLARHPEAVVLFDEMEKAHPAVLDPLLQLLDEGRFQELSKGLVAYAPGAILLFTTNLLAREAFEGRGEIPEGLLRGQLVHMGLRPEFVNRLDMVVGFRPFGQEELRELARLHLKKYLEAWKKEAGIRGEIWVDEGVYDLILSRVDPRFGARDLQRAIEGLVADPLAEAFLAYGGRPSRVEVRRLEDSLEVLVE